MTTAANSARRSVPRETVLLVDDDAALTEALGEFFEEQGYAVAVASDGRTATEALRGKPPKLVLLDLRLPDCDGLELMREAQRLETPPDVIVVTGRATSESTLTAMEAGAAGYLVKPVDLGRLGTLTARLMERRRAVEGLADLGRRLGRTLEPESIGAQITDSACALLGVRSSVLARLDAESKLIVLATAGRRKAPLQANAALPAGTTADAAIRERRPITRAGALSVPVILHDSVVGSLTVEDAESRVFDEDSARVVRALADHAATALENARVYHEAEHRRQTAEHLATAGRLLSQSLDFPVVAQGMVEGVRGLFGVLRAALYRLDPKTGDLHVIGESNTTGLTFLRQVVFRQRSGVVGLAIRERRTVLTRDLLNDPSIEVEADMRATFENSPIRAAAAVPLMVGDEVLGVLALGDRKGRVFDEEDARLLEAFAGQAAVALNNTRLYGEARERLRETTILLAVGQILSQPSPMDERMRLAAREVARVFEADSALGYINATEGGGFVPIAAYRLPQWLKDKGVTNLPRFQLTSSPELLEALKAGRAVASGQVVIDPRLRPEDWPAHSAIFAPTLSRGEIVGGLGLYWWQPGHEVTPADARLLEALAAQLGMAMDNAELARQTQSKLAELETLLAISAALSSTLDLEAIFRDLLRRVAGVVRADMVGVYLLEEDGEWLTPRAGYRVPAERLEDFRASRLSIIKHVLYAEAARTRRPVFSADVAHDPRIPSAQFPPHRSQLFVPIIARERLIGGFLAVWWTEERTVSTSELALMETIANQSGVALENARLFAQADAQRKRLGQIFDSTRDGIMFVTRDGLIEAANRRVAEFFVVDGDRLISHRLADVLPQAPEPSTLERFLLDQPDGGGKGDLPMGKRILHWVGQPTTDGVGETLGFTITLQDVTEEREISQMKTDFVSFVTHQLRTPLSGIKWLLELANQEEGVPEGAHSYIEDARGASERLITLVNDLLDISRLERGKLEIKPISTDLNALTREVLDEVHLLVEEKRHRLTVTVAPELPAVMVDPQLVRQVILNLTSNAIKYTPTGGVVEIGIKTQPKVVLWRVKDTGIGVPREAQKRLFEKFYRADNVYAIETEGTGLGLYLVRLIVEQFGGRVWCESEENKGATFSFTLPLAEQT